MTRGGRHESQDCKRSTKPRRSAAPKRERRPHRERRTQAVRHPWQGRLPYAPSGPQAARALHVVAGSPAHRLHLVVRHRAHDASRHAEHHRARRDHRVLLHQRAGPDHVLADARPAEHDRAHADRRSPISTPCTITPWPIVTPRPMRNGAFTSTCTQGCPARGMSSPISIQLSSPRIVTPNQMPTSLPSRTSPTTVALSDHHACRGVASARPCRVDQEPTQLGVHRG